MFTVTKKEVSVLTRLMKAVILENYAEADSIISDESFDPNMKSQTWGAPVLIALVTVLSGVDKIHDKDALKEIFKKVANHPKFDPNVTDAAGETVLMHIARTSAYNWLVPVILMNKDVNLTLQNSLHLDVMQIASRHSNNAMLDILLLHKRSNHRGLPKKIVGRVKRVKKPDVHLANNFMHERLCLAYDKEAKENEYSMYYVLKNFLDMRYDKALEIIRNEKFNPNEMNRWDEPALTTLIYISQDQKCTYTADGLMDIAKAIIYDPSFDVNCLDNDYNTPLMVSMQFKNLHWLTEALFVKPTAKIDLTNDMGLTLLGIAIKTGDREFYNELIQKSYQEVRG